MSSARSVSQAAMPSASRASLRPISWVTIDLTFTTSSMSWAFATSATIAHASAASRAQRTVAPAAVSRSSRRTSWVSNENSAASLIAAPASRSSSQLSTSATTRARLSRMVAVACARLRRSWVSSSAALAATGNFGIPTNVLVMSASVAARISARCITRTPARWRVSAPPMFIRQLLSPATSTSAPVSRTWRALSETIATDVSAFLTANVPPKPQHSSARGSSTRSSPRTRCSSRTGRSPTPSIRSEWQVGW